VSERDRNSLVDELSSGAKRDIVYGSTSPRAFSSCRRDRAAFAGIHVHGVQGGRRAGKYAKLSGPLSYGGHDTVTGDDFPCLARFVALKTVETRSYPGDAFLPPQHRAVRASAPGNIIPRGINVKSCSVTRDRERERERERISISHAARRASWRASEYRKLVTAMK